MMNIAEYEWFGKHEMEQMPEYVAPSNDMELVI
jgi:hypothetical protein